MTRISHRPAPRPSRAAPSRSRFFGLPVALLATLLVAGSLPGVPDCLAAQSDGSDDAWAALTAVRDSLHAAGPTRVDFVQTYVPAGFSSGEEESGTLALQLPDCMRWDYSEPYPKNFLLCGDEAWYWNPEDGTGRHYPVDRQEEPGLDLVLLGVDQLQRRYRLEERVGESADADHLVTLHLEPVGPQGQVRDATLVVDRRQDRLLSLAYTDTEGNRTHFALEEYRNLQENGVFHPPAGVEWTEESP